MALGPFRLCMGALASALIMASALLATGGHEAHAQTTTIVALGASDTRGKGVSASAAWPARLQATLKAKGLNVRIINAGRDGDTSSGMLARLDSAVPSGTRIVILQSHTVNDRRRGVRNSEANFARIRSRLAARGIRVVNFTRGMQRAARRTDRGFDGRHAGPRGHARIAASLLPQVRAAIGR
jgi:acyl-CoA thioesterase-1